MSLDRGGTIEDGKPQKPEVIILPKVTDLRFIGPAKIMTALWVVLTVSTIIAYVLYIIKTANNNLTQFLFTYDLPVTSPGTLLSTRFSFYYWLITLSEIFEMTLIALAIVKIVIPWDYTFTILHVIVSGIALLMDFIAVIGMIILGQTANDASDPLNPLGSEFKCAANAHPNNPALTIQGCPMPTAAYSITVDKLAWNSVSTNNFGFTWAFIVLEILQLTAGIMSTTRFKVIFSNVRVWIDEDNTTVSMPEEPMDETMEEAIDEAKKELEKENEEASEKPTVQIGKRFSPVKQQLGQGNTKRTKKLLLRLTSNKN
jgi:hypothetical protein